MDKTIQCKNIPDEEIFAACRAFHAGKGRVPTPDIALADKYPVKVIMKKMDKLADKGKLEYGVSLRTAWVVETK